MPFVKQMCLIKMAQKKTDTFNLALHDDILKQSLAKSSVQYVFLSLLLQRMQGWARQSDQNEVISTLPMASQQLTTMPMIESCYDFACGERRKEGDHCYGGPASRKTNVRRAEYGQPVWFIPICTGFGNIGVVTEVSITEEILNQLKRKTRNDCMN